MTDEKPDPSSPDRLDLEDPAELVRSDAEAKAAKASGLFSGYDTVRLTKKDLEREEPAIPTAVPVETSPATTRLPPLEVAALAESVVLPKSSVAEALAPAEAAAPTAAAAHVDQAAPAPTEAAPAETAAPAPAPSPPPAALAETAAPAPAAPAPSVEGAAPVATPPAPVEPPAPPLPPAPPEKGVSAAPPPPAPAESEPVKVGPAVAAPQPRTEEDDRLRGALIFLAAVSEGPGPFARLAGSTLIARAVAACKDAAVPLVVLALGTPEDVERARAEARAVGFQAAVEAWDGETPSPFGERGRVVILDASSLHDSKGVVRLSRWRGERAAVLVSRTGDGDGLRVQVDESNGRVTDVGADIVPFNGVTCGAISVPLPLFSRITGAGELGALVGLARDGLLSACVEGGTFAREMRQASGIDDARAAMLGGASAGEGPLEALVTRRLARPFTSALLPQRAIGHETVQLGAAVVGVLGAAFLALDRPGTGAAGGGLLVVGAVFHRVGCEVARVRGIPRSSRLEAVLNAVVLVAVIAALAAGIRLASEPERGRLAALVALAGGLGSLLGCALALGADVWAARDDTASRLARSLALGANHRDTGYLVLAATVAQLALPAVPVSLVALVLLSGLSWVWALLLLAAALARPR